MKILLHREIGTEVWHPAKYPDVGEDQLRFKAAQMEEGRRRSTHHYRPHEYVIGEVTLGESFEPSKIYEPQ